MEKSRVFLQADTEFFKYYLQEPITRFVHSVFTLMYFLIGTDNFPVSFLIPWLWLANSRYSSFSHPYSNLLLPDIPEFSPDDRRSRFFWKVDNNFHMIPAFESRMSMASTSFQYSNMIFLLKFFHYTYCFHRNYPLPPGPPYGLLLPVTYHKILYDKNNSYVSTD
jgi:hypothetical protein